MKSLCPFLEKRERIKTMRRRKNTTALVAMNVPPSIEFQFIFLQTTFFFLNSFGSFCGTAGAVAVAAHHPRLPGRRTGWRLRRFVAASRPIDDSRLLSALSNTAGRRSGSREVDIGQPAGHELQGLPDCRQGRGDWRDRR